MSSWEELQVMRLFNRRKCNVRTNGKPHPSSPSLPSAILRRMRRMILPDRVLGRPGAQWMVSGTAKAPACRKSAIWLESNRSLCTVHLECRGLSVVHKWVSIAVRWCSSKLCVLLICQAHSLATGPPPLQPLQ